MRCSKEYRALAICTSKQTQQAAVPGHRLRADCGLACRVSRRQLQPRDCRLAGPAELYAIHADLNCAMAMHRGRKPHNQHIC